MQVDAAGTEVAGSGVAVKALKGVLLIPICGGLR